jgi:CMP-N,N'-diacetyllegionaminic acid synthase
MSTIAIIPARSGSKGIPDKNIKLLSGIPLMAYSIKTAKEAFNIDRVIVSTDSELYAQIAKRYGAEVPFLRPGNLAQDLSTDYGFIKHALDWFKEQEDCVPDYLVHLRPTTPLRKVEYVEEAISIFKNNPIATALRSIQKIDFNTYKACEMENGYLKTVYTRLPNMDIGNFPRQMYPDTYWANGYVDVLRVSYILKEKRIHGDKVMAYVTPPVVDIDSLEDFKYLEFQQLANGL